MVKDSIHRLNIRGSRETYADGLTRRDVVAQQQYYKVLATNSAEEQVILPRGPKKCPEKTPSQERSGSMDYSARSSSLEPIYAVVDLKHKYAQRKMRSLKQELKRCNSYDSIIQRQLTEPRELQHSEKSTSSSEDDIEGIYEDGEAFIPNAHHNSSQSSADAHLEEENIYEPINVPSACSSSTTATTPNALWKYLTRLKLNSMRHLTRMRGKHSPDYDTIKMPPTMQKATTSHFSNIKHKFGTHRKSMQLRMRKLCARAAEPRPFFQQRSGNNNLPYPTLADNTTTTVPTHNLNAKKPKYRWRSMKLKRKTPNAVYSSEESSKAAAAKPLFGSLPHMRRKRISLFNTHHSQLVGATSDKALKARANGETK